MFLDLMSYCANALLGVLSTDLSFFESNVPIVVDLYSIFIAVGWGLLIGNCAFQCMKAMFAGFGFETESPAILLMRTGLFGFLLIFSKDICEIGLSIGKNVIDLLEVPTQVALNMPVSSMFSGLGAAWLLVIIIGFILGFQLIKLFFEIAERYVVVAVLTLLMPVGLAMGGSKSTKDICTGYVRMYATMIVMMVMNVLFLKLILSALATMPSGTMVLPWCLLVVGIAKTARKADQLISKIGLNPAITGDPLGTGRGFMVAMMAARTIMSASGRGHGGRNGGGRQTGGSKTVSSTNYSNTRGGHTRNSTGGTNVGGNNMAAGTTYGATTESNASTQRNSQNSNTGDSRTTANTNSSSNVRFGTNSYGGLNNTKTAENGFNSSGKATVNNNRFGSQTGNHQKPTSKTNTNGTAGGNNTIAKTTPTPANSGVNTKTTTKGGRRPSNAGKSRRNSVQQATNNARKTRFGSASSGNSNASSNGRPKTPVPNIGGARSIPDKANSSVKPDNFEATDTAKEVLQDIGNSVGSPKDGENNG